VKLKKRVMEPTGLNRLDTLVAAMLAGDEDTRYQHANEVARLGYPAIERALRLTGDADPLARQMACYVLANVEDPTQEGFIRLSDGIPTLIYLLEHETHEEVLASAMFALGHLAKDHSAAGEAVCRLSELVHHSSAEIRYAAAHALGSFWVDRWETHPELQPVVGQALVALARDSDADVRDWAVFGLHQGCHDTPEVRACFWRALEDPDLNVRGEAAAGLAKLGDRSFIPRLEQLLREDDEISSCYFEAAAEFGDPALLPAVLEGERRWRESMEEGEELHYLISWAIEALSRKP
jgi:HEAT repeat protein